MKIDLDGRSIGQSHKILAYCVEHSVDLARALEIQAVWATPLGMLDDTSPWVLDIPPEHISWLTLKDLL